MLKKKYTYKSNKKWIFSRKSGKENQNTKEMILSEVQNEIHERKSKSQRKWLEFERRKSIKKPRRMTFFDDENTKLRIIWIYNGNGIRNKT